MATTSNNSGQRVSLRVAGLASAAALGGLLLLELIAPAQAAADVLTETGTVTLSSTSSTQAVLLDQFDPAAGMLNQVTITVAVDASADVEVTNLTPAAKATTVTLDVTASAAGPGGSGATATAIDTASSNLAPNASFAFGVEATADEDQVVTDPAVLGGFVGTGTVSFNLTGLVGADVEGPSTWRGRGAMQATATVTLAYDFTPNAPPTAVADSAMVVEDDPATAVDVLANDTDVDGGPISIAGVTQPANGTVAITGGGTGLTYQPNLNYCNDPPGTTLDTFTYTLAPGTSTATVSVTVTCVDDVPMAVVDAATVAEDSAATTIDVLANDTDPEGDAFIVGAVTQPANGTVAITNGGDDLTYQPDLDYCNTQTGGSPDTFDYTLDPGGSTATVSVTVACIDDPPTAVDDTTTVAEDDPATAVDVLANDTDIDGGPISVASVTQPANGAVVITGSGTGVTYQPNPNFCSTTPDTFTYTLAPGGDTATVSVTVTCVDDPPTAVDDAATVVEDDPATAVDVLANDTDIDGGPISVASVTQPANGAVVITGSGTGVTYEPNPNFCSTTPDTFTYTLAPGGDTATVSVTVTCVDDSPTAVDDEETVVEDDPATAVDVLANDTDIDGGPISVASVTQPANGAVVITGSGTGVTYQPNPNFCSTTPDTFTYTLAPGGDTATVSVTVTCVDDSPTAVDDEETVVEDDPATAVDVLANDTDIDGGPISVASVTQPANGAVVITGSGTGVTYEPNPNFCSTTPDTFTYTLAPGGDTATVSVTVTCVDDPPTAVDDAATVAEDDPATAVDVLANDTDVDGGPITVVAVTQPANGSVVITNLGDDLTYQPDPDYCNTSPGTALDTFSYTLNGGSSATVTVTVTCVIEDPTAVDDTATVAEDNTATTIDVLANDVDPDSAGMTIGTVTQPTNGTVAITNGGADLSYQPDPDYCNTQTGGSPDTFTYTLDPGADSATVSVTVTCVDDPPTAVDDATTVLEDAAATAVDVLANDTDIDAGPISIASVTQPANGTVVITGSGTGVTYQPNPNYCNTPPGPPAIPLDAFTYTLTPGTSTAAVLVTVTCVNDAPTITLSASTPTFTEGGPAVTVDNGLTVTDIDDTNLVSGTVSITAGAVTGDTLTFTPAGGIIDSNAAPGVLDLTGTTTIANWQTVLQSVQYSTTSDNPTAATRTVSFTVNDGNAPSNTATKPVTVVPVNDAPVLTQPDTTPLAYTEGAAPTVIVPNIGAVDVDSTTLVAATIDIGTGYAAGQDVLSLGTNPQNGITATFDPATGTLTLTGTSTVANYQAALRDVRYANTSQDPTAGTRTISFQVDDGPGPNDLSNIVTRGVNVTPVNDPPVAGDDSFLDTNGALANTRLAVGTTTTGPHLAVAGTVLSNDTDVDTATGLTAAPATISSANCAGCNNVTLNPNGSFTYDPPADFTGNDTFTYTVNDNDPETPANQTDTATVTIEVFGPVVWYVDVDAPAPPAGQGGRSHSPFQSLAPLTAGGTADGLDGDGDIIFLGVDSAAPIAAYDGGIVLETNQRLWGEPFGLTVDPGGAAAGTPPSTVIVAATPATPAANNPNVRNSAVGGVGITLANGVDIQRVNAGITGTASSTAGISGTAITTATVGPNQLVQGNATGITLTGAAGGNITVDATTDGNTATAVNVGNRSSGTVSFTGTISGSAGNAAIVLANNTGAAVAFTGPINLAGSGAAISKFSASGGGTITANNAANQITGFTGTGINLSAVNIGAAGITFNTVSSAAGGAANGILLTNVAGPGAFNINGGAITATTRALDVDDNTANITIAATLTTSGTAARSVEVTNRDGGTVDINSLVTDTSQGINLQANGTGTIRFDGGVLASTGANTAFNATGGGTIAVTQNNTTIVNTLTSTTGTTLNVANTTIHTDDLTFRSISANGAASGIVLNTTGASGGLTVTGNGGACTSAASCTGGAIQNSTGPGLSFTSVGGGVSLTRMSINNGADDGIRGASVVGFAFDNSRVVANGNAVNESGLDFVGGLTGTASISSSMVGGSFENGMIVTNASGSLNLTVTGSTLNSVSTANSGNDGLHLDANNTAAITVSVTGSTFSDNRGDHFQFSTNSTSSGTNTVTFSNNTLVGDRGTVSGGTDLGAGIVISPDADADTTYTIANNNIQGAVFHAIAVAPGAASVPTGVTAGTISGNTIGTAGTMDSGSAQASGIAVYADGDGVHTTRIENNQIREYAGFAGIDMLIRDGSPTLNATITGNTISNPSVHNGQIFGGPGILATAGAITTDAGTICVDITGNTLATGRGDGITDFRLRQRFGTTIRLPNYSGGASDTAAVVAFVQGNNPGTETGSATANFPAGGGGFTGGASACPTPP